MALFLSNTEMVNCILDRLRLGHIDDIIWLQSRCVVFKNIMHSLTLKKSTDIKYLKLTDNN